MPYTPLTADQATLEAVGRKLRVKDTGLDARKTAECKTYTNPPGGFTIEHDNRAVVHVKITTDFWAVSTSATTAIADGSVVGQKLRIIYTASGGMTLTQLRIKNNANTKLLGEWVRTVVGDSVIPAWLDLIWDGQNWQQNNTNDGQPAQISGTDAHAEGNLTIASGAMSHAEGISSVAAGNYGHAEGQSTEANGESSHAMGAYSVASLKGQFAQAALYRAASGDSQFTRFIMRGTTTSGSPVELAAPSRFTLDDDKVYACRINVAAFQTGLSNVAWFNRMVLVSRGEGTLDVKKIAEYTIQDIGSNAGSPPAGWAVTFSADDTNHSLKIEVTGAASTYWVAVIECVEVA